MDDPETQVTLGTKQTKTNKTKNTEKMSNRQPHRNIRTLLLIVKYGKCLVGNKRKKNLYKRDL